jgi:putative copper resistance protein D
LEVRSVLAPSLGVWLILGSWCLPFSVNASNALFPAGAVTAITPEHESPPAHPPGHHVHPGLTPEETKYSVFMHHAAGVFLLLIGSLVLADRLTGRRYPMISKAIGLSWIGMGIFLFIRSDPEAWPIGPPGFIESFSIPTTSEWIQHKVLSMIPMFMGLYVMKGGAGSRPTTPRQWHYVAIGLAAFGGLALLVHMHVDHPDQTDLVNLQHRWFASNALFIVASLILDLREAIRWRLKPYLLPMGLLLLGYQLVIYVE